MSKWENEQMSKLENEQMRKLENEKIDFWLDLKNYPNSRTYDDTVARRGETYLLKIWNAS